MISTRTDKILTADTASSFLKISKAAFWRQVAAERLPAPFYPAARAPRWSQNELVEALERTRAKPRDAMAKRRANRGAEAQPVGTPGDAPAVSVRAKRAMELMGVSDPKLLKPEAVLQMEKKKHKNWRRQYPDLANISQTTFDELRHLAGLPSLRESKEIAKAKRSLAIEVALTSLLDEHERLGRHHFTEHARGRDALKVSGVGRSLTIEHALRAVMRHDDQYVYLRRWERTECMKSAAQALNWKNYSVWRDENAA